MYVNALATVSLRTYQFTKVTNCTIHNTANKQQFWLHKTGDIYHPAVHCTTQQYTTKLVALCCTAIVNNTLYNTTQHYTTVQCTVYVLATDSLSI